MNKLTSHAKDRFFERFDQEISRKKIVSHIENGGEIIYAKRLTATRSLAYVIIEETVFKIVINRKSKMVISLLPFNDLFIRKFKIYSEHYNNKTYIVELYPDCYNECKSIYTLTEIFEVDKNNDLQQLPYNHPFFEGLFRSVWKIHQGMKGLAHHETSTSKIQKGFIEIKLEITPDKRSIAS